jgi:phenylalanyl-tRNA synthetase beta chain
MGGQVSEVSEGTTRVLLEAANWNGTNVLRTSRKLGLRSEASARFEKGLHPELCIRGQIVAARLFVELCGAKLVPGTIDVTGEIPDHHHIGLREEKVGALLGMEVGEADQIAYLERLGFHLHTAHGKLLVEVPADRHSDVTREVDLIEEIGRIHGLEEHLPSTLPAAMDQVGGLTLAQRLRRRAEDAMRDLGFDEIVGWSFTDPGEAGRLRIPEDDPRAGAVAISNPLSEDQSAMRTTLLGSLLDVARGNIARGADRVALFESGRVYLPPDGIGDGPLAGDFPGRRPAPFAEPHRLGSLAVGDLGPASWRGAATPADFFAHKGVLEGLASRLGVELAFEPASEPFLHPGRSAAVLVDGDAAGWVGEVHPLVCRAWDVAAASAFEIDLAPLVARSPAWREEFEDLTTHPAVLQDLAVVVEESVPGAEVRAAVIVGGGELLRSAEVFDLYQGEQLGDGRKSLALRLEFRAADRTLTDEEVAGLRGSIAASLKEIGGTLRE